MADYSNFCEVILTFDGNCGKSTPRGGVRQKWTVKKQGKHSFEPIFMFFLHIVQVNYLYFYFVYRFFH